MTFDLVDPERWAQLDARLRDAVSRNPSNAAAAEVIRAPLVTLRLLARDATAVLAGDPLAAERMRVTLHAAAEAAALVAVATAALGKHTDDAAPPPARLIRMQALAVVAAAGMMVADDAPGMRFALLVITGLALQGGPAELLARLEPFGAPADAYDNLVRLTVPPIVAAGVASRVYLRGHARDPLERARWRCLLETAARVATSLRPGELGHSAVGGDPAPVWTVATADAIDEVAVDGGELVVRGDFGFAANGWPADDWAVVGARPPAAPLVAEVLDANERELRVRFAAPVAWLGLVERARRDRVARARARLRAVLRELADDPCLRREPPLAVEVAVPALDDAWPIAVAPPRTGSNQPPAGSPQRAPAPDPIDTHDPDDGRDPDAGLPGGDASDAADGDRQVVVVARVVAADREQVVAAGDLTARLIAVGRRLGLNFDVVELPWVEDALAVTAAAPTGDDDPRLPGMLEAVARAAARTPGREAALWLAVVPGDASVSVTAPADAARGIGVTSLPALPATLLALLAAPTGEDGVAIAAGRYKLVAHARLRDGDGARRGFAASDRVRLVGRLDDDRVTLLEPARLERRAAGSGAPFDTGVVAIALDAAGREVGRARIRGHRDGGPTAFAALVPVVAETAALELRKDDRVLARIPRWDEPPTQAALALADADGVVTATWSSPRVAAPIALTVEVSDGGHGDWVPVAALHPCAAAVPLPLWRLAHAARVRVVACDGWHAIASEPHEVPAAARFGPVAIRRIHDRLLWAEVPTGGEPRWLADGTTRPGRTLPLAERRGSVRLSLEVAGATVTDTTELVDGADDRR